VLGNTATFVMELGRLDEALALYQAAIRRDPVNVSALYNLGNIQRLAGHYDAAIASYHTVLNLSPGQGGAHALLGITLLLKGDTTAAVAEIEQEKNEFLRMLGLPMTYHALGHKADSDQALTALIAKYGKELPYFIAQVYAFRGEADKAFEWLEKAFEDKNPDLSEIAPENLFDKIRSDSRWLPFLRKLGRAPEQLATIQFKITLPP
jgi:tetratricopeptide (TPR) repeat protein